MQAWIPIVGPALLSLASVLLAWFVKRSPDARSQIERDIKLRQMLSLSSEDGEARKALTASIEATAKSLTGEKSTWRGWTQKWSLVLGWFAVFFSCIVLWQLPKLELGKTLNFVIQLGCFGVIGLGSVVMTTWILENLTKTGRTHASR